MATSLAPVVALVALCSLLQSSQAVHSLAGTASGVPSSEANEVVMLSDGPTSYERTQALNEEPKHRMLAEHAGRSRLSLLIQSMSQQLGESVEKGQCSGQAFKDHVKALDAKLEKCGVHNNDELKRMQEECMQRKEVPSCLNSPVSTQPC